MKIILKASAGTGKTYRLSLEYIASLLKGENYEEIVVMTFTNKATAEIKERIFKFLNDIIIQNKNGIELIQNIKKIHDIEINMEKLKMIYNNMIKNRELIKIYTIDSFINFIFKKIVAPQYNIFNYEIINTEKHNEILLEVLKKIFDNPDYFEKIEDFLQENMEKELENYTRFISGILGKRWLFYLIDKKEKEKYIEKNTIVENYNKIIDLIMDYKDITRDEIFKFLNKDYQKVLELSNNEIKEFFLNNSKKILKDDKKIWNGQKIRNNKKRAIVDELTFYFNEIKEEIAKKIYNNKILNYEKKLKEMSEIIYKIYDEIVFREKKFTHSDISNYVYDYLFVKRFEIFQQNLVVQFIENVLGNDITSLFIDEFQDTSVLQWKILKPFIRKAKNLIFVGDEKQSIYRFRGGEKELFQNLNKLIGAKEEYMNISYRTDKNILNFINIIFSNIPNWKYYSINPIKNKDEGYVYTYVDKEEKDILENLINTIKNKIKNRSNSVILARNNKELTKITEKLKEENIAFITNSNQSIIFHRVIKPVYSLLKYFITENIFFLLEFLRNDIIYINDMLLKEMIIHKKEINSFLFSDYEINIQLSNEIMILVNKIKSIYNIRNTIDEIVKEIYNQFNILDTYNSNNDIANINKFYDIATNYNDISKLILELENNINNEKYRQASGKDKNAISVMTIHKAKGLEFENVLYYIKNKRSNEIKENYFIKFDKNYEKIEEYIFTHENDIKTLEILEKNIIKEYKRKNLDEEINNHYVAMTRPKKNLFVFYCRNYKNELNDSLFSKIIDLENENTYTIGEFKEVLEEKKIDKKYIDISNYKNKKEINKKEVEYIDLEREIKRKIGLATHYYLSFIKYNKKEEHEYAKKALLNKYGNMFGKKEINNIFLRIDEFIKKYKKIFNERYKVFTELELYHNNKKYILDRVMIDNQEKIIHIYDYKTGGYKLEQLRIYKNILEEKLGNVYKVMTGEDYYLKIE
ncbi:ATP-dependent exoDNAse (exonuclease V) beta subunit [Hypnocyclicus thermotrophus]|uniref:DNA 3'-5' helicase n=1 Tax=Hypnocyclicus thermotrophus TaxID=1627895 RepID=A0AA46I6D3_9FUSO|nr:UvrD-helicase domain-containing protein [Hypnocyclicus thermotrophus]TDT72340.1 ATP-dependent exoDNAse (exonuclease V) beta subunit [Hypnocyclicus thermotrophus]